MSWTDQNEIMRLAKEVLGATGTNTPSEKSMISQLASSTGVAYNVARDAYVKGILDPLLQEKVRNSMSWLIHANFVPTFVDGKALNADFDGSTESFDPSAIRPDGIQRPKRMFNIDTGNLEDWPSGQYVILSHSWKGAEISYAFITKIKESRKKMELYEMVQDDSNEEAKRFARFQAEKFKHLKDKKTDLELISAQCTQDVESQAKKIDTILGTKLGTPSRTPEFLVLLAELKKATLKENKARDSCNEKINKLEMRKAADKSLVEETKEAQDGDSETPNETDGKDKLRKESDQTEAWLKDAKKELDDAETGLKNAKEELRQAEELSKIAKANCEFMDKDPALLRAVEDLLTVLERKKSMNKIEGSIREAKKILQTGLFPRNDRKRYLWNDTCCINKGDANELTESLAMMGQWYNNADFCLVHLDTPDSTEWVSTWEKTEDQNYDSFSAIVNAAVNSPLDAKEIPKWSTRGWTLQELVLSKMTFYVNSGWKTLPRSVEGLGPYYSHCSYLKHHIRDVVNLPPKAKSILQNSAELAKLMDTEAKVRLHTLC
jgi:hypothetical protein